MAVHHDLVIRNGLIVDGGGGEPYVGDVAISGGRLTSVGQVDGSGDKEIDATGCVVCPGFIDVHTHYDGQAIWSEHLSPTSFHGVTTAVMGNCGVGFAPCRPGDHQLLVNAMEGVEDIPEVVMTTGLSWDWETFSEYLDALESRRHDIDIAAYVPHSPLRVYAMGQRGADREIATPDDNLQMASLARSAVKAGAVGFSTSRTVVHRRGDGQHIPSYQAEEAELEAIADALGGRGIVQLVTNLNEGETAEDWRVEVDLMERLSRSSGLPVTFTLNQINQAPESFNKVLEWVDEANSRPGVRLRPQFSPRPIGVYIGFSLSANPFSACPTYRALESLPLEDRIVELRKPEVRERIINEPPSSEVLPIVLMARQFDKIFPLSDPPNYEPAPETSVAALAARQGKSTMELIYDLLLENDGKAMLYIALSNYAYGDLNHVAEMFGRADTLVGLADGGAHYGMVCDASYTTFILTHWTRERSSGRISLPEAVRRLTSEPAEALGFGDRGLLAAGRKADLNVLDYDNLRLALPEVVYDLPGGGKRIHQAAQGYRYTIVSGVPVVEDDQFTGSFPGRLVRGTR
jgi:N-acyl-D-amino-acid deacylase